MNQKVSDGEDGDEEVSARQLAKKNLSFTLKKWFSSFWENLTYDNAKDTSRWFLESAAIEFSFSFDDLMMLLTLFVLFGSEIRVAVAPPNGDHDDFFEQMTIACFSLFIVELVLVTWSKTYIYHYDPRKCEGYFMSFFFWLDVLAIVSMLPEIAFDLDELKSDSGEASVKGMRVVRMVRLVRIVKLYKIQAERRRAALLEAELLDLVRQGAVSYEDIATQRALYEQRQSKVGGLLSDSITRRVITIVLLMVLVVPVLTFAPNPVEDRIEMTKIFTQLMEDNSDTEEQENIKDMFVKTAPDVLAYRTPDVFEEIEEPLEDVNEDRKLCTTSKALCDDDDSADYKVYYDMWPTDRDLAVNQIYLIIFVSFVLVFGSIVFTQDAQRLVLDPIERMMNMVEAVSKDPLQPLQFQHGSGTGEYETMLLETTIEKITGLLRVGFGEAGAGIIKANLDIADNSSLINPLIPGLRIYAIFGFCDIHHFDDVNQFMGQDVLTFVNTIAEIVHSSVHEWGGQSNKNLGNAFLMIWRIGDEKAILKLTSGQGEEGLRLKDLINPNKKPLKKQNRQVDLRRVPGIDRLADKALIGYLKIIAELNRSRPVLAYRNDPRLTQGGTTEFKVRMGFGLHAGWAIEGAVGSVQKVDATYLSPHVNMSARLETSSKQFGVPLLFSQSLFELMSPEVQDCCRRLDVVTVKGSENPIGVYTYDARQDQDFRVKPLTGKHKSVAAAAAASTTQPKPSGSAGSAGKKPYGAQVAPDAPAPSASSRHRQSVTELASKPANHPNEHHSFSYYQTLEDSDLQFMSPENDTSDVLELDVDMVYLRRHVGADFMEKHKAAVESYLAGEWAKAVVTFEWCDQWMRDNAPGFDGDGPSRVILNYMKNRDNKPPADWKGYRPLTSK